jgi:hypothetical protein
MPRFLPVALAALLIVSACSSVAGEAAIPMDTVSPPDIVAAPTARPTPRATPRPTPKPSLKPSPKPAPAATPTPEGAATLKIGAPYRLVANPANQALHGSVSIDLSGAHIVETLSGREIRNGATLVGYALVLDFNGIKMSRELFEAAARGGANNSGGKLSYTTILGRRVAVIISGKVTVDLYALHDSIVMVFGVKAADTKPLLTSVIKANP